MAREQHGMTGSQRRFVIPASIAGIGVAITVGPILVAVTLMYVVDKDAYIAVIGLGLMLTWPLMQLINDLGLRVHKRVMARRRSA